MSNAIRYDSLLLRAVARSLSGRLAGRTIRGVWLDRVERSLLVRFGARERRTPDTWLHWHLHPGFGDILISDEPREPAGSTVQIAAGSRLVTVEAVPDERILCFQLDARDAAAGFARRIVIELIGSRWNALALGDGDAITALLQVRERGGVPLRPGAHYVLPDAAARTDALTFEQFNDIVDRADDDVRAALLHNVAYISSMNATYIAAPLVTQAGDSGRRAAYTRYTDVLASHEGFVLPYDSPLREGRAHSAGGRGQPYPHALGRDDAAACDDVLAAFAIVAQRARVATPIAAGSVEAAAAAVYERIRRVDERIAKLEREARNAAAESATMRHHADLLFAQLHKIPRGAASIELDDFEGGVVHVTLDPALSAKDNATRLHERARRRELATERVPALLVRARAERDRLQALQQRVAAGSADAAEIQELAREVTKLRPNGEKLALPYRTYRTTGGLEVRAGRNSRANDELTFHHASPDDIWLHARDVPGSHVVLRWTDRNANPPARDLGEAACIAAVNSRARTSGIVPVDWTRRKYVRKRRKAPPGQVVVERSKTIFAVPDAAVERKLLADQYPTIS